MVNVLELFELAVSFHQSGDLVQAETLYRQILQADPVYTDAFINLGIALQATGRSQDAVACFREAVRLNPGQADGYNNLGNALKDQGALDDAVRCYRQALSVNPDLANAHNNLGVALVDKGELADACACFRQALRINPHYANAHNNLGNALQDLGQDAAAVASFRRALELNPNHVSALNNLGNVFKEEHRLDEAEECYRGALQINPRHADAYSSLASVLKTQGRLDEALNCIGKALQINPNDAAAHSNLILMLHYHPGKSADDIMAECRRWNDRHAAPFFGAVQGHANDKAPERRLRIGYVSPDFRVHPVARNFWPLVNHYDPGPFEIFLYSSSMKSDGVTKSIRGRAVHWRDIMGLSDDRAADLIRQDRIDILVDLAMHTPGNCLLLFARKPAPVQVACLGITGGVTGLETMDYRLTDPYIDPPGGFADSRAEAAFCLPSGLWYYEPPTVAVEISEPHGQRVPCSHGTPGEHVTPNSVPPLPAIANGFITFGCLNNFCKINEESLRLWSKVLGGIPGSHLLLKTAPGNHRQRTLAILDSEGIAPERVEFAAPAKTREDYAQLYRQIDIGLDTFPYNGHSTSLDAFWMGVPIVTLVGPFMVGRVGWSELCYLGLEELAAHTAADFVHLVADLAGDLPRLQTLRSGLRARMQRSVMMDPVAFTRGFEAAYRVMWRRWVGKSR